VTLQVFCSILWATDAACGKGRRKKWGEGWTGIRMLFRGRTSR